MGKVRARTAGLVAAVIGSVLATSTAAAAVAPYKIEAGTGTLDPGTTMVAGSNCDDCAQSIALPFPVTVYGQSFTTASADSNGALQFAASGATVFAVGCPLPQAGYTVPTLLPFHGDLTMTAAGKGIFTSTSGSAPNRTFNIEWRADHFAAAFGSANFEVQLHEGSPRISYVYGTVADAGANDSIGIQQSATGPATQFSCRTTPAPPTPIASGLKLDVVPSWTLTASKGGLGSGTVTSADPGISCGATCSASFDDGSSEVLTATPAAGSGFVGWTGCDSPSGAKCTMAMTSDKSATANFDVPPKAFTASASAITLTGATLAGTVNGGSGPTTFQFEYGKKPTLAGAAKTAPTPVSAPNDADHQVSRKLKGLKPGRRYYYRVLAANSAGEGRGAIFNFQARPPATAVITKHPGAIVKTSKPKAKVTFAFGVAKAGAFRCKLDRSKYATCKSPTSYRVRPGKHKFAVRAVTHGAPGRSTKFKFEVVRR